MPKVQKEGGQTVPNPSKRQTDIMNKQANRTKQAQEHHASTINSLGQGSSAGEVDEKQVWLDVGRNRCVSGCGVHGHNTSLFCTTRY